MSRRTRKNVGLIGLGIIGNRVRDVLRRKGFHVFVWNRTPCPVPNFVGAPAELAEMCDYIQIFVSDDEALDQVVRQLSPGLGPRHIVLAHSTVTPFAIAVVAEAVAQRGARFVEAPFTGSKEAAEKGELVYYVAGDDAALREARPILEATSKQIIEFGQIGHATAIKLATNMVTAASVQAAAEALALVQAAGVPADKFVEAMQGNASNSATLSMKLPKMMARNFEPHFSIKHMLKDMQIANRLGLSHHLELAVSSAARDRLLEQMQAGHGEEDYSAIVRKYFPDIRPAAADENDLDLFDQRPSAPVASEPAETSEVIEPATSNLPEPASADPVPAETSEVINPESSDLRQPAVTPEPEETGATPEAFPQHIMPDAYTVVSPEHSNGGVAVEESHSSFSEKSLEEEPAPQRGFFSRLLRRGTNG
jgi:3-hydroxyisobutyrate dehydrogenase-like beta-hydroxyacid dehydrogenase